MDVMFEQGFETLKGGGPTVPVLLLMFACVMGWFPGHNARRRQHARAARVAAASWCLIFVSVVMAIAGLFDGVAGPLLVAMWVGITTWSYGRTAALPKANRGHAFEVVPTPQIARPVVFDGDLAGSGAGS